MPLSFEDFLGQAPGLFATVDSQFRCRNMSPAFAELQHGQIEGHSASLLGVFTSQSVPEVRKALESVIRTNEAVVQLQVEYGHSTSPRSGHLDAWLLSAQGDAPLVAVTVTPVQIASELEKRLQEFASHNQMLLDSAGDGIYGIDANGCTTFVNRAASKLLGWQLDDILGQPLHDIHHHSYKDGTPYPREACPIYAALRDGQVHRVDDEVFWSTDGTAIPVEYTSTPILKNGEIRGAVVVFRDIRDRLESERQRSSAYAELEQVRHRQQLILEAAGEGIYGLDSEGNATFINRAATELLGWKMDDMIGKGMHEVHHHSHADGSPYPRENCPVYAALRDGEVHRVDNEVFWASDGSAMCVEYTSTPILSDEQSPEGAVVVFRDITERKRVEKERDDAFAEVRELNRQLELERDYLREEVELTINFGEIVGESPALKRTLSQIHAVAKTPVNVLILGESGVGKEMIARAIHAASDRSQCPLVRVNCASIPRELFESEFFGHVKGAFTGAHKDRVGRMQLADGGTLFLDEVGEIPLSLQSKLLRALQENEFERVGDDQTSKVDVRIVAATNRDLRAEVEAGRFREDLYYRLSVFPVEVPPLRERKEDIVPLARHFVDRFCKELGREPVSISKQQASLLQSQRWSGNIRELKNVMERAVILSQGKRLQIDFSSSKSDGSAAVPDASSDETGFLTESEFRELEKNNLIVALRHANWRVSGAGGAADLLDIKPSTLSYRMKTFGITSD